MEGAGAAWRGGSQSVPPKPPSSEMLHPPEAESAPKGRSALHLPKPPPAPILHPLIQQLPRTGCWTMRSDLCWIKATSEGLGHVSRTGACRWCLRRCHHLPACSALVRNQCILLDRQVAFALGFFDLCLKHDPAHSRRRADEYVSCLFCGCF